LQLVISLFQLNEQVNEPLGDGLPKVVLYLEASPDGGLKLAQHPSRTPSSGGMTHRLIE
jgi:hypothetical protein